MTWAAILLLAVSTYALKAAGPVLLGTRTLPAVPARVLALVPLGPLAALVMVGTFADGRHLVVDARLAGLAAALLAVWRRAPFLVVVLVAAAAAAGARALGF